MIYSHLDVINKAEKIHLIRLVHTNYCIPFYYSTLFPSVKMNSIPSPKNQSHTKIYKWMSILHQQQQQKLSSWKAWGTSSKFGRSTIQFTNPGGLAWSLWQRFHAQPAAEHLMVPTLRAVRISVHLEAARQRGDWNPTLSNTVGNGKWIHISWVNKQVDRLGPIFWTNGAKALGV